MRQYKINLLSSWSVIVINIAIVFFLTPVIIETFGTFKYGIWILINSVVSYISLMEAGVNISTGRFVNIAYSRDNTQEASGYLSSSLAFYTLLPLVVVPVSMLLLVVLFPESKDFELIRLEILTAAFFAVSALLLNLISSNIRIKLNTNQRFELVALIEMLSLLFNAALTLVYMKLFSGESLAVMSLIVFVTAVLGLLLSLFFSHTYGVALQLRFKYASSKTFKKIINFSIWVLLSNLAVVSINHSDNFIISGLINVEAVSTYAVGFMISFYLVNMLSKINQVKNPEIQQLVGRADVSGLTILLQRLITNNLIFSIPVIICFYLFIDSFILLWLGEQFSESAVVAKILAAPSICILLSQGAGAALWAKGLVKTLSLVKIVGAMLNIVLSVVLILVFELSLVGVAIATSLVSFLECFVLIPFLYLKQMKPQKGSILLLPIAGVVTCFLIIYLSTNLVKLEISDWIMLVLTGGSVCSLFIGLSYLLCSKLKFNIEHEN